MADLIAFPYDSLLTNGDSGLELDRAINASMYRRLMSKYFTTGVFPNDTDSAFKVLAFDKNIIVKKGSANINGVYAELEEDVTINITDYISSSNTVTLAVALRSDDTLSARKTTVQIVTNNTNQLVPPTRNSTVYEIYVAKVELEPNAITVYQSDITDLRLNTEYCGVVTATVKGVDTTTFYDQFQGALDRFLETVQSAIDGTTAGNLQNQINERIKITDIVDNLESTDTDKPLSANQGNKLAKDVTLWTGNVNGYSGSVVLTETPFNFKWLIFDALENSKHTYAIAPVIDGRLMSNAMAIDGYKMIFITDLAYKTENKTLNFGMAKWVDQQNNAPITIVSIYGRM